MQKQKFDEIVSYFNKKVSEMEIETKYKMELLGMVTALGYAHEKETHDKRTETHACDSIRRQDAIDALCAVCGKACDKSEFVYNAPQDEQVILCPEHYCLCTLPPAQSEQRWIPCSERLPERSKDVLVTRDYDGREDNNKSCRYVEVASCYGEDDDITWNSFSDEYKMKPRNHHVIAWMPLPSPYQAERREE